MKNLKFNSISAKGNELKPTAGDEGKVECETPQYGSILSCIHQELFKACPEVKNDQECQEIKNFMEKCPMRQPPLKQNKQKSWKVAKDNLSDAMKDVIRDKNNKSD